MNFKHHCVIYLFIFINNGVWHFCSPKQNSQSPVSIVGILWLCTKPIIKKKKIILFEYLFMGSISFFVLMKWFITASIELAVISN